MLFTVSFIPLPLVANELATCCVVPCFGGGVRPEVIAAALPESEELAVCPTFYLNVELKIILTQAFASLSSAAPTIGCLVKAWRNPELCFMSASNACPAIR